ncbi:MAG: tetratricopeptide repeat protein, partial [Campylobacterota bacterium]|nr:tetratricopeptide repeat protein [Campylobacterota bacterium]
MNSFFIEYRDPLFSIIVFFSIIFMITFFSYWWSRYKRKEDSKHLDDFLKQFHTLPSKDELNVLISSGELSQKSWLLLARSYSKNGDYEKSIEIYNELLRIGSSENKNETMFLLGKTYFKAGFLERSKQVFLSILKSNPRTPQALNYLLLVYESMRDYESALEVLEPLEELNKDIELDRVYLKTMQLLSDTKISQEELENKLIGIYSKDYRLTYLVFEYLFRVNPKLAWENFDSSKSEILCDVLWSIDAQNLNLDIISKNGFLRELYSARGDLALAKSSATFEFDILIKLEGKAGATLNFEYVCDSCKQVYPFAFSRCASCHAIDTSTVEWSLS